MLLGVVSFYLPEKKYGFIVTEDKTEYFIHFSNIEVSFDPSRIGKSLLNKGEFVSFNVGIGPDGREVATNIRVIKEIPV